MNICNKTVSWYNFSPVREYLDTGGKFYIEKRHSVKIEQLMQKLNKEIFENRAIQINGNKYDYCMVIYVDASTKVEIICAKHGSFWQRPYAHLQGRGCLKCSEEKSSLQQRSTLKHFIARAIPKHKILYDYSKSIYINSKTGIIIGCPIHGDFIQTPNSHLSGIGCKRCGINKRIRIYRKGQRIK